MSLKKDLTKYKPRREQIDALNFIDETYRNNKTSKFFLMDLPVGLGKSYLALMIADWYRKNVNKTSRVDIITNSKILQDQYSDTYESISDLKGKDNYECESYSCSCSQGSEFNRLNKTSCESCPYSYARENFITGGISLTNFYLYILYSIYNPKLMENRGSNVLIVDECLHPETEITLFDNTKKKIKDIEIGDLVKTINEETGFIENKPVVKLHHNLNKGKQMYDITIDNGDILKITGNHKVKLIDGTWKKVEDLSEEDRILSINEKICNNLIIKKIDYNGDVYNLHIKDNHNYFANNQCVSNCHEFDDVMSNFISIKITENIVKRFKFNNEYEIINRLNHIRNIEQYVIFLKFLLGEIMTTIESMENGLSTSPRNIREDKRDLKISKLLKTKNLDIRIMQLITDMKQYQLKIEIFLKEYKENPNNWVLETSYNEKTNQKEMSVEPIWAYDYLDKYVFSKYDMVFLMSGTILDKSLFCQLNGLDVRKAVYYSIDSPFNAKNRPIYYIPLGKMSYNNKAETFKRYIPYIKKILQKYDGKKGIIHTNSFELANWINESIKDPRLIFHDTSNKDEMLELHLRSEEPTVLVSPALSTGVSFDNDSARFQIIAKIPYPSLSSQKNKLRMKNNPDWYSWKTSAGLQQACGRIVRSNLDYGDTIILDSSFGDVIKYSSKFLPEWFQKAIKRINIKNN
jgi:Rad3-related DNA helicase